MASVTASPGTLASDNSAGAVAWSNASNAASSNDSYATCVLGDSQVSHYLKATNFDFSAIPDGSTINGVKATMERKGSAEFVLDSTAKLVIGGVISGTNLSNGEAWFPADASADFGDATSLWGLTPTAAQVKASDFGAVFQCQDSSGGANTASVDHIQLTVYYTPAATGHKNLLLMGIG